VSVPHHSLQVAQMPNGCALSSLQVAQMPDGCALSWMQTPEMSFVAPAHVAQTLLSVLSVVCALSRCSLFSYQPSSSQPL
jgi:hypothetical protein